MPEFAPKITHTYICPLSKIYTPNPSQNPSPHLWPRPSHLNNPIKQLRNKKATQPKNQQPSSQAPEPGQIALGILAGDPDIHAPQAGDDVHRQHNGAEDGELAEHVGGLLLALVHADVDLGEVVAVGAGEDPGGLISME